MAEEIIIDGVDVAGCKHYKSETCLADYLFTDMAFSEAKCVLSPNCYFKQLKRTEQENKELKTKLDVFAFTISNYESALEEINITAKQLLKGVSSSCINNTPYLTALSLIENKINGVLND